MAFDVLVGARSLDFMIELFSVERSKELFYVTDPDNTQTSWLNSRC